jgi:hypothetical protein
MLSIYKCAFLRKVFDVEPTLDILFYVLKYVNLFKRYAQIVIL